MLSTLARKIVGTVPWTACRSCWWVGILAVFVGLVLVLPDPPSGPVADAGALRTAAEDWVGVPYRMGGEDRTGIDCSGLTRQLLEDHHLPRRAQDMRKVGRRVSRNQLQAGDLLFFDSARRDGLKGHVGVALGPDDFVHATTSRGVVIQRLDNPYWAPRLLEARRTYRTTP